MNTLFLRNMTVVLLLALAGWRMWGPGVQADKLAVPGVEQVRLTDAVPQQVREGNSSEERFSLRRIEDVRAGDLVYARDAETGKTSLRRVVQTFKRMADHLQIVELRNPDGSIARIETSDEHPFFVKSTRASDMLGRDLLIDSHRTEGAETLATATWHQVAAKNLRPGNQIESLTPGQYATVVNNTYEFHPEGIPVYNFEVQQVHTYFVLDQIARGPPLWVHNNCNDPNVTGKPGLVSSYQGVNQSPPSPAVVGSPYSPREVDLRQSNTWRDMGLPEGNNLPIPDEGPGHNLKGDHAAKLGTPHSTQERNVNPNEEHSRRSKRRGQR